MSTITLDLSSATTSAPPPASAPQTNRPAANWKKITLLALGIILLILSAVASVVLYFYAGHWAIALGTLSGVIPGIISICVGYFYFRSPARDPTQHQVTAQTTRNPQTSPRTPLAQQRSAFESHERVRGMELVEYSFIEADTGRAAAKAKVMQFLNDPSSAPMSQFEQLAMAIMLGMACGDSVGAPYEFLPHSIHPWEYTMTTPQKAQQGKRHYFRKEGSSDNEPLT